MPELVVVLVVSLVSLAARAFWRARPFPFAPRARDLRRSPAGTSTEQIRARLIASCVIFAIISVPLILRLVPPNGIYGFRTGATQSSRAVWYSANAFMGWALLVAAMISGSLLLILPATVRGSLLWITFWVPLFAAIVASFAYVKALV